MRRSHGHVLTTHVGSLPKPDGFPDLSDAAGVRAAVGAVVRRQREAGLDIVNEGEFTKGGGWTNFADARLSGFEPRTDLKLPLVGEAGQDRTDFADFYRYASERGVLFYDVRPPGRHVAQVCTAPLTYVGQGALRLAIEATLAAADDPSDVFLTTVAPASLEPYRINEHYGSQEEFLFALADAMREEYEAIARAGLLVQVDDAWLPALWDRIGIQMGLDGFRRYCAVRVEALNHGLRNVPEEQIRYHLCWGSWHGPHAHDLEMRHIVDLMLSVKAQAYSFEAANARHEHEFVVWDEVKLPEGKILLPGCVSHATNVVEHPELVAQRIRRFAERVGAENVIASTDCGFGGRTHPQIGWAKLAALVEGARLASRALY
ncbi:MAG: cobalamin-independent methionine synthase II family protein [Hyphomonadaceae bacterium]|nr:cobalamin-independent methionine synthase II family protein [Hyphomonadaceae bacterium]